MLQKLQMAVTSPKPWLVGAGICFLAWGAVAYHQAQVAAERALVRKTGIEAPGIVAGPDLSALMQTCLLAAVFLTLIAALCQMRLRTLSQPISAADQPNPPSADAAPTAFQPIKTQEELVVEDRADRSDEAGRPRASRLASEFAQSALWSLRPVRNRR